MKCGKNHLGECRQETTICYQCGKEGHYARGCMIKTASDDLQNKNQGSPLRLLEAMAVGPNDELNEMNVLEPNVKVYVCTKGDAEAGSSTVVIG